KAQRVPPVTYHHITCAADIYPTLLHADLPISSENVITVSPSVLNSVEVTVSGSASLPGSPGSPSRPFFTSTTDPSENSTRVLPSDRKSTRLNLSHVSFSYAVFFLTNKYNTSIV